MASSCSRGLSVVFRNSTMLKKWRKEEADWKRDGERVRESRNFSNIYFTLAQCLTQIFVFVFGTNRRRPKLARVKMKDKIYRTTLELWAELTERWWWLRRKVMGKENDLSGYTFLSFLQFLSFFLKKNFSETCSFTYSRLLGDAAPLTHILHKHPSTEFRNFFCFIVQK